MIRRILAASILSIATAISGLTVVAQAATTPSATTTLSGSTQTVQTGSTTQTAAPSIDCGTGIVATVCTAVLGPICHDRCFATGTAQAAGATSAPTTTVAEPRLFCEPAIQEVCYVIGAIFCHSTGCPAPPALQLPAARITMRQF